MASYKHGINLFHLILLAELFLAFSESKADGAKLSQLEGKSPRRGPLGQLLGQDAPVAHIDNGILNGKEEDSHNPKKRIVAATAAVVSAGAVTISALIAAVNAIGNVQRKISIGITNDGRYQFEALNTYFFSGTSDQVLPNYVPPNKGVIYTARKTSGAATGAVGVISFYITNEDITLCVLFSVPYDYNLYSNWWNAKVYQGKKYANYNAYNDLYYSSSPFKGDNRYHSKSLGWHYTAKGVMSSSGTGYLQLSVKKQ
ncbi:actinoporin [Paramuricea clavata]|uniref:Actinoporin, partial n=1 Tax=Paramuricea clavata TaxID=317549 RepID=A0A6S7IK48_PARCT|nr:actinoporin [Paramuricea clavata]